MCLQDFGLTTSDNGGGNMCNISFQCLAMVAFGVCSMNSTSSSMKNRPICNVGSVAYIIPLKIIVNFKDLKCENLG